MSGHTKILRTPFSQATSAYQHHYQKLTKDPDARPHDFRIEVECGGKRWVGEAGALTIAGKDFQQLHSAVASNTPGVAKITTVTNTYGPNGPSRATTSLTYAQLADTLRGTSNFTDNIVSIIPGPHSVRILGQDQRHGYTYDYNRTGQ